MGGTKEVWVAASALSLILASQSEAQQRGSKAGTAGFVRPGVDAVTGGQVKRINIGDSVFRNQKIVTDSKGRIQLLLRDRSVITVGPNSEVSIDKYVFNSEDSSGEMIVTAAKGFARFVGGLLSKRRPIQVRTAYGTIGIRGAIAAVVYETNDAGVRTGMSIMFFYGTSVDYTSNTGASQTLAKFGYKIPVDKDGNPGTPVKMTSEEIASTQEKFEGTGERINIADSIADMLDSPAALLEYRRTTDPLAEANRSDDEQGVTQSDQSNAGRSVEGIGTGGS